MKFWICSHITNSSTAIEFPTKVVASSVVECFVTLCKLYLFFLSRLAPRTCYASNSRGVNIRVDREDLCSLTSRSWSSSWMLYYRRSNRAAYLFDRDVVDSHLCRNSPTEVEYKKVVVACYAISRLRGVNILFVSFEANGLVSKSHFSVVIHLSSDTTNSYCRFEFYRENILLISREIDIMLEFHLRLPLAIELALEIHREGTSSSIVSSSTIGFLIPIRSKVGTTFWNESCSWVKQFGLCCYAYCKCSNCEKRKDFFHTCNNLKG